MSIRLSHVSKSFDGAPVLTDFSAEFPADSITCLTGVSGGGKTTLLRLISGLERPDSGEILGGKGLRFGWVFQENRLLEHLTTVGNLFLTCGRLDPGLLSRALASVCLTEEDAAKPVSELSGGQKRRVAILRAILSESDALLLDEPFTGLDDATKSAVIASLLASRKGRILIAVTHDSQEIATLGGISLPVGIDLSKGASI
jgi:NitT/TauT family transport system ATP-binding protein